MSTLRSSKKNIYCKLKETKKKGIIQIGTVFNELKINADKKMNKAKVNSLRSSKIWKSLLIESDQRESEKIHPAVQSGVEGGQRIYKLLIETNTTNLQEGY